VRSLSKRLTAFLLAAAVIVSSSLLVRAQLPHAVGAWASAGAAADGRTGAAAVPLPDGRTLIAGGRAADGTITDTILVRDAAGALVVIGTMIAPRTGHAAALLADGRVLFAGGSTGDALSADLEIFDPAAGSSSLAGAMAAPRTAAAAAQLADGSILIAGGTGADGTALATTQIFDPKTGLIATAADLQSPRSGASATTLIDGRVLVAGGNDGTSDLSTAEIFEPAIGSFSPVDTQMSAPRSGHSALLLPHNNSVLIAGGSADGNAQATADLFLPAEFPDPYSYGMGQFAAASPMAIARSGAISGPQSEGFAFVSGGGAADEESYRFPTIRTDKDDYAPGQLAIITGTGWQRDEVVRLRFQEDPAVHDDYVLEVTADADGNIQWDKWAPETHDLGVRFYLIARGMLSGRVAQTTFTDGQPRIVDATPTPFSPSQPSSAGVKDSTLVTARNQGGGALTGFEIRVRTSTGALVRAFVVGNLAANTNASATWDGKNAGGAIVADGAYTVRAFATGPGENTADNDTRIVVVDNTNPVVTLVEPADAAVATGPVQLRALPVDTGGDDENIEIVEFYVDDVLVGSDDNKSSGWRTDYTPTAGGSHTWFAKAYDKAGNNAASGTQTFVFDNDATAPVITPNVSGTLGNNGWYVSDVSVTWTVTDPESTVSSTTGCDPASVTSDTTGTTFTCSATSGGGTNSVSVTIKRDATAPNAPTGTKTPAANAGGWNNTDVTVSFAASGDNGPSGIASCSPNTSFTAETTGTPVSGNCTDNAGNTGPDATVVVRIDKTRPVIAGQRSVAANGFGWNNTDVTVTFTCADTGSVQSGIGSSDVAGTTLTTENANHSVTNTGTCVDNAGNAALAATVSDIRIDKTAPNAPSGARSPAANAAGWNNSSPVAVTFSDTGDAGAVQSGIDACVGDASVTAETAGTDVVGTCTDKAGNTSAETTITVRLDLTKPIVTGSRSPLANPFGWNNTDVTVSFSCADSAGAAPSGIASNTVEGATLTAEGAGQSVANTGTCADVAGNVADPATVSGINIDKTAPTIVAALDRAAAATGWFNIATGRPSVTFTCGDALSGLEPGACPATVGPIADGADQQASGNVTDRAGNVASASVTDIDVDLTPPAAAIVAPAQGGTYVLNASVASNYSCSDATSGIAQCAGPVVTGSPFLTSSVGATSFTVNAVDVAGNPGAASADYSVLYATGVCLGSMGHQILEPVNTDGSSIFKQKSTVPSKFRVCDANGVSIGSPGVVAAFALTGVSLHSSPLPINEEIVSTTPDAAFRWSPSDQQWIFNLSTKNLTAGRTYSYTILLNDGSTIVYGFTLK
jgi:hypothetical protein